jgi:hypothetical protein
MPFRMRSPFCAYCKIELDLGPFPASLAGATRLAGANADAIERSYADHEQLLRAKIKITDPRMETIIEPMHPSLLEKKANIYQAITLLTGRL